MNEILRNIQSEEEMKKGCYVCGKPFLPGEWASTCDYKYFRHSHC